MKQLRTQTAVVLILLAGGLACRKTPDVVPPVVTIPPVVTTPPKDTTQPGPALIKKLAIAGIPDENISIDQATKLITVVVPEVPVLVASAVSATVTPGYTIYPGTVFNLFYNHKTLNLNDARTSWVAASYTITLSQPRPLEVTATQPLVLATGSRLSIPVKNFYENDNAATAVLTNTRTGEVLKAQVEAYTGSLNPEYIPNQFFASFDANSPAGDYTLDIVKVSGRTARSPQPVSIRRGLPMAYPYYWYPFNLYPGGQAIKMPGVNLYAEDRIELLLTSRAGKQYKLTPASYAPDGKGLTIDLPADLKPVPYSVQMIRKGQLVDVYTRLVVRKDINQPAIVDFWNVVLTVAPTQAVVLQRGKSQIFNMMYSPGIAKVRLRFTSVSDPATEYLVDAVNTQGYLSAGPDGGYPSFTLPMTMLPGRYTVRLQHILQLGTAVEGEPMERDIDVQ